MIKHSFKFFTIVLFLHFSCVMNDKTEEMKDIHQSMIGEKVDYFESVISLNNETPKKEINNNLKFTIVAYYNGGCSFCYLQLIKWKKLVHKFNSNVQFKFVLSGNSSIVLKYDLEQIDFPLKNVYYDEKEEFKNKYNFLLDSTYVNLAMLLDENDKILFIGNPIISKDIMDNYIEIINYN